MNASSIDIWSKGHDLKHGDGGSAVGDAQTTSEENDDVCNWKRGF